MWQGGRLYEQQEFDRRIVVVLAVSGFFFCIIIFRLFYLQVIRGKHFADISERNRTQIFFQPASRGIIYDVNHDILVDHRPTFVVLFSPLKLTEKVFTAVLDSLEGILGIPYEELLNLVGGKKKHSIVIRLADEISREAMFRILEARPNLPGVTISIEPTRRYPFGEQGAHLVGYLGEISAKELSGRIRSGYKQGDIIGKTGIEKVYDYYLRGVPGGMQLEVDASGRSQRILYDIPTIPGNDVILNIDRHIQQAAEEMFLKNEFSGAAVAIDPANGRVRALVSSPNFDPTLFLKPLDADTRKELFQTDSKRMFNRALQGQYALGSVFKIIVMAAALENDVSLAGQTVQCKGKFRLGRREFRCWKKKGHGTVGLFDALTYSCDVYFYQLGLAAGLEAITKYGKLFGFGALTNIDLPGETVRVMPDAGWKKRYRHEIWYDGDTVNLSIGQGFLLVSPVQAANMMAAVASRGKLFRPYILDRVVDSQAEILLQGKHRLIRNIHLATDTWDRIHAALVNVVESGTGRACRIRGIEIAGKTSTVQNPHGDDHAWFEAYAALPGEKPRIACAVLVEHGKHGASAAAPIVREMIRAAFPEVSDARQ